MLMDNQKMEHKPAQRPAAPQPEAPYGSSHMAPRSTNLPLRKPTGHRMSGKTKALIIVGAIAAVVVIAFCVWFFWLRGLLAANSADPVYVTPVSSITGVVSDLDPRYSGLVEPQQITKVSKDESRTVSDVLVAEGDEVYIGQALFSYDTDEIDLSIRQAELELEGISNELTILKENKATLEKEKKNASKDDQFKYTVEINSVDLQIKSQEYQRSVKQTELEKLRDSMENNQVFSEVEGVIQEIHLTPSTDNMGNPLPFMSILSSGEFRIKGTVTEMNIGSLMEGQAVTVRSRVDPDSSWKGTIDSINYEPVQDNNNMYYYDSGSGEKASKYNFYVTLDYPDGLILGQHVYIEPDTGSSGVRTGLWLPSMYVVVENNGDGFVWARDEDEKLEKRRVLLGEYDEGEGLYEILSGLSSSDYIAISSDDLVAGGPTTTDASAMVMPEDNLSGGFPDDGYFPEDDGSLDANGEPGGVDEYFGQDGYFDEDGNFIPTEGGDTIPEGGDDEDWSDGELQDGIMPRGDVGGDTE